MRKKICVIPARGGSKRIPKKNIKEFIGKPIIAYSIKAALSSKLFDVVMVSTDDDIIATIARNLGAHVPFMRSPQKSNDYASTVDVLLEVLEKYKTIGLKFEFGCCIYPTAPFVNKNLLISSFSKFIEGNYDSFFPALRFSSPIQRALKLNSNNRIEMFQPLHLTSRSQDLETAYHDAGQFYWFRVTSIQEKRSLWTDNSGVEILSEMRAHDIDHMEDWEVAEFKYRWSQNEG